MNLGIHNYERMLPRAIPRLLNERESFDLIAAAREIKFRSVKIDLIYGMPQQTLSAFERTLEAVIAAHPNRVTLRDYAELTTQSHTDAKDTLLSESALKVFVSAVRRLSAAGYQYLGMDEFSTIDDPLAIAQRSGRLQRNLNEFSTYGNCDQLALGLDALGSINSTYSQNFRTAADYSSRLLHNMLPIMRGLELSADDLLRSSVINALICHSSVSKEALSMSYFINFDDYFKSEIDELRQFQELGVVYMEGDFISLSPSGRLVASNICSIFDRYSRRDRERQSHSRVF